MNNETEIRVSFAKDKNLESIQNIQKAVKENDGYCPCRAVKTEDTRCMCKDFRDQIDAAIPGKCHCGLYEINVK